MSERASDSGGKAPAQPTSAAETLPIDPRSRDGTVGGIVLDVPDVLYDATQWRRWLVQLVSRLGVRVSYGEFDRAWDAELVDVHRGRREFSEALETFLVNWGLSWAQVDEIEAASRIQRQKLEFGVRPLPGVVRTIDELVGLGLVLVAWADAPHTAARLAERLERLVPHVSFDAVLTSFDLECTQPAPECYQAMLGSVRLPAQQVVYVGHDARHLAGARAGGLRTVACNHEGDAKADHYLIRFDDLGLLAKTWPIAAGGTPRATARRACGHATPLLSAGADFS